MARHFREHSYPAEGLEPSVATFRLEQPATSPLSAEKVEEGFLTVRASLGWRRCEEVEDGLPDGRHARLWWWPPDSFFPAPLL